jgi:hypothetical protein
MKGDDAKEPRGFGFGGPEVTGEEPRGFGFGGPEVTGVGANFQGGTSRDQ